MGHHSMVMSVIVVRTLRPSTGVLDCQPASGRCRNWRRPPTVRWIATWTTSQAARPRCSQGFGAGDWDRLRERYDPGGGSG